MFFIFRETSEGPETPLKVLFQKNEEMCSTISIHWSFTNKFPFC